MVKHEGQDWGISPSLSGDLRRAVKGSSRRTPGRGPDRRQIVIYSLLTPRSRPLR